MNLIKAFIKWTLEEPCSTEGCAGKVSRWVDDEPKVQVHGVYRLLPSNMSKCPICRRKSEENLNRLDFEEAIRRTYPLEL